jgi:hypothetical protein
MKYLREGKSSHVWMFISCRSSQTIHSKIMWWKDHGEVLRVLLPFRIFQEMKGTRESLCFPVWTQWFNGLWIRERERERDRLPHRRELGYARDEHKQELFTKEHLVNDLLHLCFNDKGGLLHLNRQNTIRMHDALSVSRIIPFVVGKDVSSGSECWSRRCLMGLP